MHRFFLPPTECQNSPLRLTGGEARHARNVLRLRQSARVIVLNGAGREFLCQVMEGESDCVFLEILREEVVDPLPYRLTLFQALTKGKAMDLIVQKAAELGVRQIVPVISERSVPELSSDRSASRLEKWRATAIEAIKQCGSAWLPKIEMPASPASLLKSVECEFSLIATLQDDARHPREQIDAFTREKGRLPMSAGIWIGPEGDFTPTEINAIRQVARPITLGPLILRSETAAIYSLSVLNYELQFL